MSVNLRASDLDTIAEEGAEQARAVATLEYEIHGRDNGYRCLHDGGRFRVELFYSGSASAGRPDHTRTYDAAQYYEMQGQLLSHGTSPDREMVLPVSDDPTLVMYYWLLAARRSFVRSTICNGDAWREVLASGQYVGDANVNGISCREIHIAVPNARTDVYFAKAYRSYPLRWSSYTKVNGEYDLRSEARVERFVLHDTDMGKVLIPLETTFFNARSPVAPNTSRPSSIVETSLKVNQPVDVDRFTLTPLDTTMVIDRDQAPTSERADVSDDATGRSSIRTWVVLANLIVVLGLALVLLARAVRKGK